MNTKIEEKIERFENSIWEEFLSIALKNRRMLNERDKK